MNPMIDITEYQKEPERLADLVIWAENSTTAPYEPENNDAVRAAIKRIDMAVSKGVIHKNAGARKKSRLMKRVNAAS